MYAIVDIAGQQIKVEKGQKVVVNRLQGEKGSKVDFDKVMLISDENKTAVGDPVINGAQVTATIVDHIKGDKVFVFKKKRRKGFKKLNGHRQYLSLLEIVEILEKGAKPKKETAKAPKKEETKAKTVKAVKEAKPKAEDKKPATKAKTTEKKETRAKSTPKAKTEEKKETKSKTPKAEAKDKKETKATTAKKKVEDKKPKAKPTPTKKETDEQDDSSEK